MKQKAYRKPTTSHIPDVHVLFEEAKARGLGVEALANQLGYDKSVIMTLRRPDKHGHGTRPTYQLIKDVAGVLGYEIKLVRTHVES